MHTTQGRQIVDSLRMPVNGTSSEPAGTGFRSDRCGERHGSPVGAIVVRRARQGTGPQGTGSSSGRAITALADFLEGYAKLFLKK
jgi:hypothetical protein